MSNISDECVSCTKQPSHMRDVFGWSSNVPKCHNNLVAWSWAANVQRAATQCTSSAKPSDFNNHFDSQPSLLIGLTTAKVHDLRANYTLWINVGRIQWRLNIAKWDFRHSALTTSQRCTRGRRVYRLEADTGAFHSRSRFKSNSLTSAIGVSHNLVDFTVTALRKYAASNLTIINYSRTQSSLPARLQCMNVYTCQSCWPVWWKSSRPILIVI